MSEYQYYEWQTIDRSLTASEQRAVDGLSSHMDTVTSTQAIVTYSWGDFKHDPRQVLLKYFDAFLYDSNFGTRQLMFRLPRNLVDVPACQPYLFEDQITLEAHGKYYVLEIRIDEESDYFESVESESVLGQLTPLREQLLQGDMRMLYLAWLKVISLGAQEGINEESEPPLPAGMKKLNASLQAFADFFEIDPHLISAAAAASPKEGAAHEIDLEAAIAKFTRAESDAWLLSIARGEPGAVLALKKKLARSGGEKLSSSSSSRLSRSAEELFEQAERIKMEAKRKAQVEAERQHIKRLEDLARTEAAVWAKVENLLDQKHSSTYDEATKLLRELKDMSEYKQRQAGFARRFQSIRERYGKSAALTDRFRRAGLV
jgi:hypothetical protein